MGQVVARIDTLVLVPAQYAEVAQTMAFDPAPNLTIARGTVMGQITAAVNDVDTVTMTATGGQWDLTIQNNNGTYTVSASAYNISTAALQTAIRALPNIGAGNATVTGTAGSSYVITGIGALAGYPIGVVTVASNATTPLTGGTVSVVHTTTNDLAGQIKAYATGNTDGSQNPVGVSLYDFVTDQNGNITLGGAQNSAYGNFTAPGFGLSHGLTSSVPLYVANVWLWESDLVGLDAGAITAFGGRELLSTSGSGASKMLRIP